MNNQCIFQLTETGILLATVKNHSCFLVNLENGSFCREVWISSTTKKIWISPDFIGHSRTTSWLSELKAERIGLFITSIYELKICT